jgi:hypothetical protein
LQPPLFSPPPVPLQTALSPPPPSISPPPPPPPPPSLPPSPPLSAFIPSSPCSPFPSLPLDAFQQPAPYAPHTPTPLASHSHSFKSTIANLVDSSKQLLNSISFSYNNENKPTPLILLSSGGPAYKLATPATVATTLEEDSTVVLQDINNKLERLSRQGSLNYGSMSNAKCSTTAQTLFKITPLLICPGAGPVQTQTESGPLLLKESVTNSDCACNFCFLNYNYLNSKASATTTIALDVANSNSVAGNDLNEMINIENYIYNVLGDVCCSLTKASSAMPKLDERHTKNDSGSHICGLRTLPTVSPVNRRNEVFAQMRSSTPTHNQAKTINSSKAASKVSSLNLNSPLIFLRSGSVSSSESKRFDSAGRSREEPIIYIDSNDLDYFEAGQCDSNENSLICGRYAREGVASTSSPLAAASSLIGKVKRNVNLILKAKERYIATNVDVDESENKNNCDSRSTSEREATLKRPPAAVSINNNNNNSAVGIGIVIKNNLFDTVKQSSVHNTNSVSSIAKEANDSLLLMSNPMGSFDHIRPIDCNERCHARTAVLLATDLNGSSHMAIEQNATGEFNSRSEENEEKKADGENFTPTRTHAINYNKPPFDLLRDLSAIANRSSSSKKLNSFLRDKLQLASFKLLKSGTASTSNSQTNLNKTISSFNQRVSMRLRRKLSSYSKKANLPNNADKANNRVVNDGQILNNNSGNNFSCVAAESSTTACSLDSKLTNNVRTAFEGELK